MLTPVRRQAQYRYDRANYTLTEQPLNAALLGEAVSYYQTASELYQSKRYGELSAADFVRLLASPQQP